MYNLHFRPLVAFDTHTHSLLASLMSSDSPDLSLVNEQQPTSEQLAQLSRANAATHIHTHGGQTCHDAWVLLSETNASIRKPIMFCTWAYTDDRSNARKIFISCSAGVQFVREGKIIIIIITFLFTHCIRRNGLWYNGVYLRLCLMLLREQFECFEYQYRIISSSLFWSAWRERFVKRLWRCYEQTETKLHWLKQKGWFCR